MEAEHGRMGLVGGPFQRQADRRRTARRIGQALAGITHGEEHADLLVLNSFAWYQGAFQIPRRLSGTPTALLDTQVVAEPALSDLLPLASMLPLLGRMPRVSMAVHRGAPRLTSRIRGALFSNPGYSDAVALPWHTIVPRIYAVEWPGSGLLSPAPGVYRGPRLFGDEQEDADADALAMLSPGSARKRILLLTGSLHLTRDARNFMDWLLQVGNALGSLLRRAPLRAPAEGVDLVVPNTAYPVGAWEEARTALAAISTDSAVRLLLRNRPLPLSWALRRVDGLYCHGGAGTTAAAISAGIPQTGLWFLPEQRWNFISAPNCRIPPVPHRLAVRDPAAVAAQINGLLRIPHASPASGHSQAETEHGTPSVSAVSAGTYADLLLRQLQ